MFFNRKPYVVKQLDYNKPFVILNFKTYNESSDENALKLALIAQKVQEKTGINIIICPAPLDLKYVASKTTIPVYAQHVDNAEIGKSTGSIIPKHLVEVNVRGSLLNHSEKPLSIKDIEKSVLKLKEYDMISIVCAKNNIDAKKIASMKLVKPNFIAIEPPELIGSEISVSTAKPDIISKGVKACNGIPLLMGAGVKSNEDMKIAIGLGARGVLLSSHFVLSSDPEKFLLDMIKGI